MSQIVPAESKTMQAVVQDRYGAPDVLEISRVPLPKPGANEVLIRIHATTVTATEAVFRQGKPYVARLFTGLFKPKMRTLGEELAGEVVEAGSEVTAFAVGDRVFGTAGPSFGAASEYVCVSQDGVLGRTPQNMSSADAAASVDGFLTAMPFLRDTGAVKPGQNVLINGASGSVGAAAVQVAKYLGATVTGVCSGRNAELVRSLGADRVIDYTSEDFTSARSEYDVIFDAVGKVSFQRCRRALKPKGVFLEAGMNMGVIGSVALTRLFGGRTARIAATGLRPAAERAKDLALLRTLLEDGTIKPVVDRVFAIEDIRDAHRYVDSGRKRGNVAISVGGADAMGRE